MNRQIFPYFSVDTVSVRTTWSGASSDDIESSITTPLERELRTVDFVNQITSNSSEGVSSITVEFQRGTDMGLAVDQVKEQIDRYRNLPEDAEKPTISKAIYYENITSLLVTGADNIDELRSLAKRFEAELLARGIAKISIKGLPEEQIAIEVPTTELRRLGLSLDDIGRHVSAWSKDVPVGIIGRDDISRQLRFREQRKTVLAFESVPLIAERQGRLLTLGSIADIKRIPKDDQVSIFYHGKPALEMSLQRTKNNDSLEDATIFRTWLEEVRPTLPESVQLIPFNQQWELLRDRINLLLKNGASGLALVILMLFLFMNSRIAWWTAVGIPVSFMAALAVLYLIGGTINMLSLFGLIMALGIIVDDAIVVGEGAMTHYEKGSNPRIASEKAAHQMLSPVFASSLTTIAAFLPLLLVGGVIGDFIKVIPTVVICVIIASLIECFLILPGHLTHSLRSMGSYQPNKIRQFLDRAFQRFKEHRFRPTVTLAVTHRWSTLALTVVFFLVTIGWVTSGRLGFQFFPAPEASHIFANVGFVAGTPASTVKTYLAEAERAVYEVEQESAEKLIKLALSHHGAAANLNEGGPSSGVANSGDHLGFLRVELVDPGKRDTRNRDIIAAWKAKLPARPGIESLTIIEPRGGPPGGDIDLRVSGENIAQTKLASQKLQDILKNIPGISGISDNVPYGREQLVLKLTPAAEALGLTVDQVSRQLRAAYNGYKVQELSDGYDDIEVRVMLAAKERNSVADLAAMSIVLPNGSSELIGNLAIINSERGFESIRHSDGKLAITVVGNVDATKNNANRININLAAQVLPQLEAEYGVQFLTKGRQSDQAETLGDMQFGMMIALIMIYLVLAWVFGSYGWPLIIMIIIPFGIVGAIWGHEIMGQELTVLSLFGFFALSGIVINDSIVLVIFYKQLRDRGMPIQQAAIESACSRLRAVLLTSFTTIAGLSPLLFETSLQAQFLIPMATTLAFGLMFSTLLVLLVVPSLLIIYENAFTRFQQRYQNQTEETI